MMLRLILYLLLFGCCIPAQAAARVVHVYVALCDNATQGIVPVPKAIGNGDDPASNLYWGCDDGLRSYFKRSKQWRLMATQKQASPAGVLERCLFKHADRDVWLVAHAYRGAAMKEALGDFLAGCSGKPMAQAGFDAAEGQPELSQADLVAFIGHNGLMDFTLEFPAKARSGAIPAIVLCCKSDAYFTAGLKQCGVTPALMTRQLMYPGSFILHAALEGWMRDEPPAQWLDRAARAYASNQKISVKAARGVFIVP